MLGAEIFPVLFPVNFEFFVRVNAAAVLGRPGLVLILSLNLDLTRYLKSLHCLEGNQGRLDHLAEGLYTHLF